MSDLSETVVSYALAEDYKALPDVVVTRARSAIADAVGVAHAGVSTDVCTRLLAAFADGELLAGNFPLIGTSYSSNIGDAAVFNGVAIHAMDYDDTIHPGPLHPSCHILPALMGAACLAPVSGRDFLTAFVAGCEIEAALALAMNPEHYAHGWHSTSTIGTLAAAMATTRLLGLDHDEAMRALGIAISAAAGLRVNIGTMTKPLHAGNAARAGLMAALLARRGFTGAQNGLDGDLGYFAVFCQPGTLKVDRVRDLGSTYQLARPHGMGLKPYACCGEATGAVEASLGLAAQDVALDDIVRITVETNQRATMILAYPAPTDLEQARFSLPFCAVAPLVTSRGDLETFSEATLQRPEVQRLMPLVVHAVNAEHADEREFGAFTTVELASGIRLRSGVVAAKGWADRFLSESEQRDKFLDCASSVRSERSASDMFASLMNIDELEDVAPVVRGLTVTAERS